MKLLRTLSGFLRGSERQKGSRGERRASRPAVETLEKRILLYATSGNAWPNSELITISFVPDGADLGGATSNLQSTFNTKFGSAAVWQSHILKAAQFWAQQTNINFAVVSDNGYSAGAGEYQQGDPGFGDIRIGGFNFGSSALAQAYLPPPINNYSIAGDIQFNTGTTFNVGSTYDLFTVAMHEFGHALGMYHSTTATACLYPTYNGVDSALNADDIAGIRAVYSAGAARSADAQEANNSTAAAKIVTIDTTTKTAVVNALNLTTNTDLDYFKFVVPAGSSATLKAKVVSKGLSLLNPKIEILDSAGIVKATATAASTAYGTTLTATFNGIAAGQTYYAKVSSANSVAAFKTGRYALVLNMGTGADPAVTYSNTQLANGDPITSGGGIAIAMGTETLANLASSTTQQTSDRAVAISDSGISVATWATLNQDGSGWNVYARRFLNGSPSGDEFLVNTTTIGDQLEPTVAMDAGGNFTISWTSVGQDGSGTGIFARSYSVTGVPLSGEFQVNSTSSGDQTAPAVARDAVGNTVITWTSAGQDGSGSGVYARAYNSSGVSLGDEFLVHVVTAGDQSDSAVAIHQVSGDFVVTWASVGQDGSGSGIYARRFNGLLGPLVNPVGNEFRVNTTTANDQTDPAIGLHPLTGDFLVTWTSVGNGTTGADIYAQRYLSSGLALGTEIRVNTSTTGDQTDSSVAVDAGGDAYVIWTNAGVTSSGLQVFAQQLNKLGQKKEGELTVNTTAAGDQKNASVAINMLGQAIVVWSGNGTADANGVYFQRYRTDLHPFEPKGHDHDYGVDHDDLSVTDVPQGRQDLGQRHGLNPGSGAAVDRLGDRFDVRHRSHQAESRSTTVLSEPVSSSRRHAGLTDLAELPAAIDDLFGSEAWLNGRYYRSR